MKVRLPVPVLALFTLGFRALDSCNYMWPCKSSFASCRGLLSSTVAEEPMDFWNVYMYLV